MIDKTLEEMIWRVVSRYSELAGRPAVLEHPVAYGMLVASWALGVLGFAAGDEQPSAREITKRYRARMRAVHPDHGGERDTASKAILDLNEARRILATRRPA